MIFNNGVWPTMIAAFNKNNDIDVNANKQIARRLINQGANGIFAVCQSSEMFFLTTQEKVTLATAVVDEVGGKINVLASGHTSNTLDEQINELKAVADTGVDGIVLVANRLDINQVGSDELKRNVTTILDAMPDVNFGLYECPYPSLRLLSNEELDWCAKSGRIKFLKDVSCNEDIQSDRIKITKDSDLKLYNANTQTLLSSLIKGYNGYNGVMGNFHIDIYKWVYENYGNDLETCKVVQEWLSETCKIENQAYPANVKYYLKDEGLDIEVFMRAKPNENLDEEQQQKVADLKVKEGLMRKKLGIN